MEIKKAITCPACEKKPEISLPSGNLIGWEHKCKNEKVGFARHTFPDADMDFILNDWVKYCELVKLHTEQSS